MAARKSTKSIPYANATTGTQAREEVIKILRQLGAESVGFMDNFEVGEVLLAFIHRGRNVQLRASAKGWAQMYLKTEPVELHETRDPRGLRGKALRQGHIAVNSILRDWIKGQATAIECGILSFEVVFMPLMLGGDGRPVLDRAVELLPPPASEKVVAIRRPA